MSARLLLSVLFATLCCESNGFQRFQEQIPNGDKVPNPCNTSTIWPGVGHQSTYGSGPRNPFGLDFYANSMVWNWTLCKKDSDGDGLTNGQELGDPNCVWKKGSIPEFSTNLSNPGICEPIGSPHCSKKNSWLNSCSPNKLNCSAIHEPGVRNYTMRFPVTTVPTDITTYICHRFTLPSDTVSDIIAIEPVLDDTLVVHHMLLYGCNDEPKDHLANETYLCGMSGGLSCLSLIGLYGVGIAGQCLNKELGFRIGPGGFKYAIVQIHWNNGLQKENLTDSSGLRIYYTTNLRPNRGEIGYVGQEDLEIPPNQEEVIVTGTCGSVCTKQLNHSIFVTFALLHMHILGKSGDIRLIRNGTLLKILENVPDYDYNAPKFVQFEEPIEVKPGDEIQINCVFKTTGKHSITHYGEGTPDEMCYGFLAYYPLLEDFGFCGQWKSISFCNSDREIQYEACDSKAFGKLLSSLPDDCAKDCTTANCTLIVDQIYATRCHKYPEMMQYIDYAMNRPAKIFEQCEMERSPNPVSHSSGQGVFFSFDLVLTLMTFAAYY